MTDFGVEQWVELFEGVDLDQARRRQWHTLFEQRYPQDHQRFLEWLGLDEERIEQIRSNH